MKKVLLVVVVLLLVVVGVVWYGLGNAGDFIRVQMEKQGSKYLATPVTVSNVDLSITEGRLTINGFNVKNPQGFSENNAFSFSDVTLDLGNVTGEPYTVQTVLVAAPTVLYEVDASGGGNLLVLKDNLMANLPASSEAPPPADEAAGPNPNVIVENVTVSDVKLMLNFEALDTSQVPVELETKAYEVTLPTFNAGPIGRPNGLPADQVGGAIMTAMLDNIIEQAKAEARKRAEEAAKAKIDEKIDEKTDELKEKAKDKLKDLFN